MDEKRALEDLAKVMQDVKSGMGKPMNENRSAVTINAGGVGVWIAATCCAVMLAANVFLAAFVLDLKNEMRDQARRISDLDAYLSAIYMQAPHLKPPEKKE